MVCFKYERSWRWQEQHWTCQWQSLPLAQPYQASAAFPGWSASLVSGCVQAKRRRAGKRRTSASRGIWAWDKDDLGGIFSFWGLWFHGLYFSMILLEWMSHSKRKTNARNFQPLAEEGEGVVTGLLNNTTPQPSFHCGHETPLMGSGDQYLW